MAPETAQRTRDIEAIAGRMLGRTVTAADPATGGGNNRVYRIEAEDGPVALKFYPPQDEDPRDRLGQEFRALEFMAGHGVTCVPRPIAADHELGCGIYEWIDGTPVPAPEDADVGAMASLVELLDSLRTLPGAENLVPASAHCFSAAAVVRQLDERLARLQSLAKDGDDLGVFLNGAFGPQLPPLVTRAKDLYAGSGLDFEADIAADTRTLSPSDFGFHNALKRNGEIVFLDFEYFGWDDPIKMISDVLWHPGSALSPSLGDRFRRNAGRLFRDREGDAFGVRFEALHPLFGMIWCLILLNEFLPERWHRRVVAGNAGDAGQARASQLSAAGRLLQRISRKTDNRDD